MTKSELFLIAGISILVMIFASCSKNPLQAPAPTEGIPKSVNGKKTSGETWETEWERTLKEARKEGKIVIITARTPEVREPLTRAFKEKFGLDLEWMVGGVAEIPQKILTERRAGIYSFDIHLGGAQPMLIMLKPHGVYAPFSSALILPEVRDESLYFQGRFPFMDKERKYAFSQVAYAQEPLDINTDFVKKEDIESYQDLLKPRWKGKIMMGDPTTGAGGAFKWFSVMVDEAFGPILGIDYIKELVKQEPVITRDRRLAAEWLLRGKYPISMALEAGSIMRGFKREGIKVTHDRVTPKEGAYLTTGGSSLAILDKAPHPNATKVFINWLLSREGQILHSKVQGQQSVRIDIPPPEQIAPEMSLRTPGVKYVNSDDEDFILRSSKLVPVAKEVFGPLLK